MGRSSSRSKSSKSSSRATESGGAGGRVRFPSAVARTIAQQAKESAAAAAAAAAKKKAKKIVTNGKGKKKSPTRFNQQALKAFRDDNSRRKRKQVHTAKNNRDAGPAESGSESDDDDARQPFPFEGDEELRNYESGYPSEEEPLPSPKKQKILSKQQPTTSVEEGRLSSDDDDDSADDAAADDDRSGDDLSDDDDVDDESNGRSVAGFKAEKMSGNQQKRYQTAIAVKTLLALQERKVMSNQAQDVFAATFFAKSVNDGYLEDLLVGSSFNLSNAKKLVLRKNLKTREGISGRSIINLGKNARLLCRSKLSPVYKKFVDKSGTPFSGKTFEDAWTNTMEATYHETSTKGGAMPLGYEPTFGLAFKLFGFAAHANPNGTFSEAFDSDPVVAKQKPLSRATQRQRERRDLEHQKAEHRVSQEMAKKNSAEALQAESKERSITLFVAAKLVAQKQLQHEVDLKFRTDKSLAINTQLNSLLALKDPAYRPQIEKLFAMSVALFDYSGYEDTKDMDITGILSALTPEKEGGAAAAAAAGAARAVVVLSDSDADADGN